MKRQFNTDLNGEPFSEEIKRIVWQKGSSLLNYDPNKLRRDRCGHLIQYSQFGNRYNIHGWEIDHIIPVVKGGTDAIDNLQPLYWKSNFEKGNNLKWRCR